MEIIVQARSRQHLLRHTRTVDLLQVARRSRLKLRPQQMPAKLLGACKHRDQSLGMSTHLAPDARARQLAFSQAVFNSQAA